MILAEDCYDDEGEDDECGHVFVHCTDILSGKFI